MTADRSRRPPRPRTMAPPVGGPSRVASSLDRALEVVGDRWTLQVVEALVEGPVRFGDLGTRLPIASNVLADRLRRLERAGLAVATPYQQRPVRLEYGLTDEGRELADAIALLRAWGARRDGRPGSAPRHEICGTELELRPWCPTCDQVIDPQGDDDLIWM